MLTHSNTVFIIVHWSNAHQYTSEACSFRSFGLIGYKSDSLKPANRNGDWTGV
ncbi:hypothetical protein HanPI659440_Chr10g0370251 [Helianthus annuus]|nr:hypothetical protein HanPI659440_Chr10g0370251 [Helianthus annuus]